MSVNQFNDKQLAAGQAPYFFAPFTIWRNEFLQLPKRTASATTTLGDSVRKSNVFFRQIIRAMQMK